VTASALPPQQAAYFCCSAVGLVLAHLGRIGMSALESPIEPITDIKPASAAGSGAATAQRTGAATVVRRGACGRRATGRRGLRPRRHVRLLERVTVPTPARGDWGDVRQEWGPGPTLKI